MYHMKAGRGITPMGCALAGLLAHKDQTMQVNEEKSGVIKGVGTDKFLVVIDGAERADVDSPEAREMAREAASVAGFGSGGMCDQPIVGPIGENGEMLEGAEALNPTTVVAGFRTEMTFAQRF